LLSHARVLQDERSGLFSHGFNDATGRPNRVHWGRGQGWALLGLADTAPALPSESPARAEAVQRLGAQIAGLAATEAEPGVWHTVVDAPETYLEPSVGAFVALGVHRAIRAGLVGDEYDALVSRAMSTITAAVAPAGELLGVSDATPVGDDAAHYGARGRGVFPWGQGPALLALLEAGEAGDGRTG
jgi:unsaturated rhamnogalacturonyl hydrolase